MRLLTSILLALTALSVDAQQLNATRSHLSTEDGLCSNAISQIAQDDYGYIWIATWNGLSRYDGYHFLNYRTGSGSKVPNLHNRILDIMIDQNQNVWLYMYDNRIFVLNRKTDTIISPFADIKGWEEYRAECPMAATSRGEIVVSIHDVGLFLMTLEDNHVTAKKIETKGLNVNCIAEGFHNNIWLGTDHGVRCIDRSDMLVGKETLLPDEKISFIYAKGYNMYASTRTGAIYQFSKEEAPQMLRKPSGVAAFNMYLDSKDLLWFCDDEMGARYLNLNTGEEKLFYQYVPVPERDGRGGKFNEVNGTVWILMNNGGYGYYNREADKVEYFHNDPHNPWDISNTVYASLELPEGVIWESTSQRGIEKLELQKNNIVRVKPIPNASSTEENEIRALYYDNKRKLLLMGNKRSSLFLYYDNGQKSVITKDSQGNPLGRIYGISKDKDDNYWICSKDHGLFKMSQNGSGWTLQNFRHEEGNPQSLSSDATYEAVQDKWGNIWIATYGGGVNLMTTDAQGKTIFLHSKNGMKDYPEKAYYKVRTLEHDGDDGVWAGTTDGVLELDYKDGKINIKKMIISEEDEKSLSTDIIYIKKDPEKTLWVGTNGGGLGRVVGKDKEGAWKFEVYDSQDGLPSEEIRSITFDDKGNAWFATEHIICSFNVDKGIFTTFSSLDGVDETRISEGGATMVGNGDILFGTLDGYYVVDRKKLMAPSGALLKLQITDFLLSDVWQSPRLGSDIDYYVPGSTSVTIPSGASNFGFRFASLNYQLQHRIHYQYMLVGYDNDWRNADNMRMALYNDVPAGKYTFQVKAFLLESPDQYDIRTMEVTVEGRLTLKNILTVGLMLIALLCVLTVVYIYSDKLIKKPLMKIKQKHDEKSIDRDSETYQIIDVDKLEES